MLNFSNSSIKFNELANYKDHLSSKGSILYYAQAFATMYYLNIHPQLITERY